MILRPEICRNHLFFTGLTIIIFFVFINRLDFIMGSKATTGEVTNMRLWGKNAGYTDP